MERAGHPIQWDANHSTETSFIESTPNEAVELVSFEPVELATDEPVKPVTEEPVEQVTEEQVEPATEEQVKPATEEQVEPATEAPVEPATYNPTSLNSNGLTLPASGHSNGSGTTRDQTDPTTNATQTKIIHSIDELKDLIAEMMIGPNTQLVMADPMTHVCVYEGVPIIYGEQNITLNKN